MGAVRDETAVDVNHLLEPDSGHGGHAGSTRATTTVNGSELKPINNFDTVPTVAET